MKLIPSLLAGLAAAALMAGCNSKQDQSSSGGSGGPKPLHLAFVTNNAANFWTIARKGTEQAAKDVPNVSVDFIIPIPPRPAEQVKSDIDDLLAKGVDGIAMSPIYPGQPNLQMINRHRRSRRLVLTYGTATVASPATAPVTSAPTTRRPASRPAS